MPPTYNHQASDGFPPVLGLQHDIASSSSNPTNFQHSQATNVTNLNSAQTSELETTISDNWLKNLLTDPNDRGIPENSCIGLPDPSGWGILENSFTGLPDPSDWGIPENSCTGLPACTNSRAGSSAAVQPSHSSLGTRQCDSTNSKATPLATMEGVDEEEEGNDTNQSWKRLKVTCGQKSIATSVAPESSTPAMLQSRPTSDANQDFENQEQELEPTSIEPENGKSKVVVQNDFGSGKSHEFSEVAVWDSYKSLLELLGRGFAPNTLASSSISTPATDSQAIETIRTFLEMDFATMAGNVKQANMISHIKRLVVSSWFPSDSKTCILPLLEQLEQPIRDYSEYDKGKKLNAQVEDMRKLLELKVPFCDSKMRDYQRLENERKQIVAKQVVLCAEVGGAVKETERNQAELNELLPQRDQFKQNEAKLKTSLVIGAGYWTILKKVIFNNLGL
ncbi:uncharacterized protein LOC108868356 isoform X2 [Pyrus x bretschneideri]|uniref:uncharacterized protein LOC108868356 isoform X2 n=1 Tax=Pyrus x bretschneideri TaxID=225117 RepID=UPI00202ECDD2|nr:uncharacterized protein LOC108868356 isoform X2 [Pyrus x bretschneideri]